MARPKLGNGVSERLQMVITSKELDEIERWRFANGIPSKSEAIRRLCQIGLFVDENVETILDLSRDGIRSLSENLADSVQVDRIVLGAADYDNLLFTKDEVQDVLHMAKEHDYIALDGVTAIHDMLLTLFNGVAGLVNAKSFRGGQRALKDAVEEQSKRVTNAIEESRQHAVNRYLGITMSKRVAERRALYEELPEDEQDAYLEAWIDDLRREEAADPAAFADRYGIDPPFWQKAGWASRMRKRIASYNGAKP